VVAIINQMHGEDHISPQLKYNIEHLTKYVRLPPPSVFIQAKPNLPPSSTLQKIHEFVVAQTKRSYFSRFMRSQDDVQLIQQYADELRHALDLFGLRSTIIIQHQLYKSAAIAQEYDDKILKSVKRNHALYMKAIQGPAGERRASLMSMSSESSGASGLVSRKSTMESIATTAYEEPLTLARCVSSRGLL